MSEEKNNVNATVNENSKDKKAGKNKRDNQTKKTLVEHYRDYKSEFDKIIWPNKKELAKQTVTVIITSLLLGAVVFVIDSTCNLIYNLLVQSLNGSSGLEG